MTEVAWSVKYAKIKAMSMSLLLSVALEKSGQNKGDPGTWEKAIWDKQKVLQTLVTAWCDRAESH